MDPAEDPAFRALLEQAKRVCAKNPTLLQPYLAAIRERGRGLAEGALRGILEEVKAAALESS
jgi:hypothetical protein